MTGICWLMKWWGLWEDIFLNSNCEGIFSCGYFTFLWPSKMWRSTSLRWIIFHFWPTKYFIHAFMCMWTYTLVACFNFNESTCHLVGSWTFSASCNLAYCHFPPCQHPAKYYLFLVKFHVCFTEMHVAERTFEIVLWFLAESYFSYHPGSSPEEQGRKTDLFLWHVATLGVLLKVRCFLGYYRSFWCCYCLSM